MQIRVALAWTFLCAFAGCEHLEMRSQSPDADVDAAEDELDFDSEEQTRISTPFIGDYVTVAGLNRVSVEGVGLVTGLDGTGDDPPPSVYRTQLLEEMRRRGVPQPNKILQSPSTALVVVRAELPPLVKVGEPFDISVQIPGSSEATSLNGGWLLETYLSEQAVVPGQRVLKGHVYAKAAGPILISTGEGRPEDEVGVLKRGRVLGGGTALKERDLFIFVQNEYRSVRNSQRIADKIGHRFHAHDKYGLKEPMAEAKTDQKIVLKVHPRYRDNFPRYLQVIRNIPFRETRVAQNVRLQKLRRDLLVPERAELASLQLEAIGIEATPVLLRGLQEDSLEVRFHSAMALAYLGRPDGLEDLAEAAREQPAFRVFALASMSALEDATTHIHLRRLLDVPSAETRYGAFRALWTLDKNDPFIRGDQLNDQFWLHVLDTSSEPMIHMTHRTRPEIVLFDADQRFRTPLAVRAGRSILITSQPGSSVVTVAKYSLSEPDQVREVSTRIEDVIRAAAELGASYPDVAQLLAQADNQRKLPGRIEIDALPQSGRVFYRISDEGRKKKERVGRSRMIPNLFDSVEQKNRRTKSPDNSDDMADKPEDGEEARGEASVADARTDTEEDVEKPSRWKKFFSSRRWRWQRSEDKRLLNPR